MERLNVKGLAIAFGVTWAVFVLFIGWAAIFGWGTEMVEVISSVYIGFRPTLLGGIIGAVWAFIDGAIWGLLIAVIYNKVAQKK